MLCQVVLSVSVRFEPGLLDVLASDTLLAVHLHSCPAVFHVGVCYELTMYRHAVRILTIYLAVPQICWLFKHLCGRLLDAELLLFFMFVVVVVDHLVMQQWLNNIKVD